MNRNIFSWGVFVVLCGMFYAHGEYVFSGMFVSLASVLLLTSCFGEYGE